jgi:PPK2 family polyphosphate:nucleotide phosphotransferase
VTNLKDLARHYKVTKGKGFRLKDVDPGDTRGLKLKDEADALLDQSVERIAELQERMYAQDRHAVLLVFQALDAAGKDSAIKHVMSGLNPQGCEVYSFKNPSTEELDHDFLWRTSKLLPRRGHIGIFNRSYYEEVLIVRVHPEILAKQPLPPELVTKRIWDERFEDINNFERYLTRQGVVIRKFFLHVSKEEQRERFLKRLDEPEKNWKFSLADVHESEHYNSYMDAYEDAIRATATKDAPWYTVPADAKWFARLVVASAIVETLEELKPAFPTVDANKRRELRAAKEALEAKKAKEEKTDKKNGKQAAKKSNKKSKKKSDKKKRTDEANDRDEQS